MNPIPYGRHNITQSDIDAVISVLKSDLLTQGMKIKEFEEAFADYNLCYKGNLHTDQHGSIRLVNDFTIYGI